MRRTLIAAMTFVVVAGTVHSAGAVFFDDGAKYIKHGYNANEAWPWPYVCPDRIAVREPFCLMVNNGWRRQNLLGAHHFDATTNKLTTAGELRVHWIMTQAPLDRRNIFVERSVNGDVTSTRLAAVRDYAANVTFDGGVPNVSETPLMSEGRPAAVVDATNVKFLQAMPAPVLPAATVGTGTGQ